MSELKVIGKRADEFNIHKAYVDYDVYEIAKDYKWYIDRNKSIYMYHWDIKKKSYTRVCLPRFIFGVPDVNYQVIHLDGDTTNNYRYNLLLKSPTECARSRKKYIYQDRDTSSKYKGVSMCANGRWLVTIRIFGKSQFGGRFKTEAEAAHRYNDLAKKYFKEFAVLNVIEE